MKLWKYYYRYFESEWKALVEKDKEPNNWRGSILSSLFIRPLNFPRLTSNYLLESKLSIVIETRTHLRQFYYIKPYLIKRFEKFNMLILNPYVLGKIEKDEKYIDVTQKFHLQVYLISIVHFLILTITFKSFISRFKGDLNKTTLLRFFSKAIYDHLYWKFFFKKLMFEMGSNKSCFLAFKGENYPMRTVMREVALGGARFISLQHGFITSAPKFKHSNPDTYFVWSEYFAKQLSVSGVKSKIEVSGNLLYNKLNSFRQKKSATYQVIFLPNSGNSNTPESEVRWATRTYLEMLMNESLNFSIHIKAHPGDSRNLVKDEVQRFREENSQIAFKWLEPQEKIDYESYDAVVTMNSTTCIEANLFATPAVILLSKPSELLIPDLISYNTSLMAHSSEALFKKIIDIQSNIQIFSKAALKNSKVFFNTRENGGEIICDKIQSYLSE